MVGAASALSLPLLFAISIILSTSPLKVKVSVFTRRVMWFTFLSASVYNLRGRTVACAVTSSSEMHNVDKANIQRREHDDTIDSLIDLIIGLLFIFASSEELLNFSLFSGVFLTIYSLDVFRWSIADVGMTKLMIDRLN